MGSPSEEAHRREDEGPSRSVKVATFWMGKFEVTWEQFEPFMFADMARNKDGSPEILEPGAPLPTIVSGPTAPYTEMDFGMGKGKHPAICMTQHAASKFCQWLSAQTGHFYRLPTEAEWEYACRAGTNRAYHFGVWLGFRLVRPLEIPSAEEMHWYWNSASGLNTSNPSR